MNLSVSPDAGSEYVVDAFGCVPARLASLEDLTTLVDRVIVDLDLHAVQDPLWHVFGGSGGITGLVLLSESHLALHTFPERRYAAINLFHCRSAPPWPWERRLAELLGAQRVVLRTIVRGRSGACHEACA